MKQALFLLTFAAALHGAIYPPDPATIRVQQLLAATERIRAMNDEQVRAMVPRQSGLFFVGCPNCQAGRQEHQLVWDPATPESIECQYCRHRYPSTKYAETGRVRVKSPRGETHEYPYWADPSGYRYFFAARRDDLMKDYLSTQTRNLALLYVATQDKQYARRAAVILQRFAEVFPGWCFHYDYPFRQKQIFEAGFAPEKYVPELRGARWGWWGYTDMPKALLEAYDWISSSGVLTTAQQNLIEKDLFGSNADELLSFRETFSNMSPTLWSSLVQAGRILHEPRYVDAALSRIPALLERKFFYDGSWSEGAPSYARQTVGNVRNVLRLAGGSKPIAELQAAEEAVAKMRLPTGRPVPVHDTWSTDRGTPLEQSSSFLLPALGHAALAGGSSANQWQAHLTWSGGYGHQHADRLSLLLFARGKELLSDIGYTHTRYRSWTLASAAHNTVLIDERNQEMQGADGALLDFDTRHVRVQMVRASGERAYPGLAKTYRRTIVTVDGTYLIDRFEVEGGKLHDYFLHGDADHGGTVQLPGATTGIPAMPGWNPTTNEGEVNRIRETHYAYGFLRDQKKMAVTKDGFITVEMPQDLRVHFLAQSGDDLVSGWNPAIRGAKEDDAELEKFQRGFFRARRSGGKSVFVSVIEIVPGIREVERTAGGIRVHLEGRTDDIEFTADGVRIPSIGYAPAALHSAKLKSIDGGWFAVDGALQPPRGTLARVVTEDGWVYPFSDATPQDVSKVLDWNATTRALRLLYFPQRTHQGDVRVEWRQ